MRWSLGLRYLLAGQGATPKRTWWSTNQNRCPSTHWSTWKKHLSSLVYFPIWPGGCTGWFLESSLPLSHWFSYRYISQSEGRLHPYSSKEAYRSKESACESKYLEIREINETWQHYLKCQSSKMSKYMQLFPNYFGNLLEELKIQRVHKYILMKVPEC